MDEFLRAVRAELGSSALPPELEARIRRRWQRDTAVPPDPVEHEARQIESLLARSACSEAARRLAEREIAHLRRTSIGSAEAGAIRNWLEWMLELPWTKADPDPVAHRPGFERVAAVLAKSHTGLEDVKNRVIEFLAVRQLQGAARGTVLCFIGPPGTGKTSMARAVAQALGRRFVHVPVGDVTSDTEMRGIHHMRPGAQPGRVLQGLFRAGTTNPVVLLDEIDKLALSSGENSASLVAILDPEQNREFFDHYLGVPYDLTRCIFLATANDTEELPEALLDRLETIRFESYSEREKLAIAREHLIPRARHAAGLSRGQLRLTSGALAEIVRNYTEEAGVRQLQRALDSLARKAAVAVVRREDGLWVRKHALRQLLGPANVDEELHLKKPRVGVSTGLAWTTAGGSMLPIEAIAMPGAGRTILTGSVGEVMRESVQTALSYVRTRFAELGIAPDRLETLDLHLHFPSGATPKDGPSAGIAIATSLVSLCTRIPVRHDVAMTGELSLLGAVLAVGGLRDKLLAALRAGIREVIVPARNSEEVLRLSPEIRRRLKIHLVDQVHEVFAYALDLKRRRSAAALAISGAPARSSKRARPVRARGRRPLRKRGD
jgi:ATP-dependent Lon protease